jgi:hypothetical protein
MAPANNYGGSLSNALGGGAFAFAPSAPALVPVPAPIAATPGVARGGGGRRIAPTPAPQTGFGNTELSRVAHARSLTPAQRRETINRLRLDLEALQTVAEEEGDEEGLDDYPNERPSKKRKREF